MTVLLARFQVLERHMTVSLARFQAPGRHGGAVTPLGGVLTLLTLQTLLLTAAVTGFSPPGELAQLTAHSWATIGDLVELTDNPWTTR